MHVLILGIPTAADHTMRVDLASQMPLRFISGKNTKGFAWGSTEAVWENQGTCGKSCWISVLLQHLPRTKFLCSPVASSPPRSKGTLPWGPRCSVQVLFTHRPTCTRSLPPEYCNFLSDKELLPQPPLPSAPKLVHASRTHFGAHLGL